MRLAISLFATALVSVLIWAAASDYWSADADDGVKLVSTRLPAAGSQATEGSVNGATPGPVAALNPSGASATAGDGRRAAQPASATAIGRAGAANDTGASSPRWDRSMDAAPTRAGIQSAAAQPLGCLIEPDQVAEVGISVIGVVESIHVERGDRVVQGQVLARLLSEVERASVGVASARAGAEADLRAAETNLEFLRSKRVRAEELVQKNFISQQALEQARAETSLAEEKLAQAREQQIIFQRELEFALAQLRLRAIRAPFDGIVADRFVSVGERVEEKPMFRVAKVDPLRIEMVMPASMFGSVSVNALAYITPELRNAPTMPAQVVLVDSLVDGASNTFRVRAHLANRGGALPSGLRCRAELKEPLVPASHEPAEPGTDRPLREIKSGLKLDSTLSAKHGDDRVSRVAKP